MSPEPSENQGFAHSINSLFQEYRGDNFGIRMMPADISKKLTDMMPHFKSMIDTERVIYGVALGLDRVARILNTGKGDDPLWFAMGMVDTKHPILEEFEERELRFFLSIASLQALTNMQGIIDRTNVAHVFYDDMPPALDAASEKAVANKEKIEVFLKKLTEPADPTLPPQAKK